MHTHLSHTHAFIHACTTHIVVLINMSSIHGFSEARGLVKITNISPHVGIVNDTLSIALYKKRNSDQIVICSV